MVEVGEYVRSKIGSIGKVTKIEEDKFLYENRTLITWVGNVIKHSKNIIDLIEVGDIVHTRDVLNEDITYIWSKEYLKAIKEDLNNGIKLVDILTFEQYTNNCYTVERKEDERYKI